MSLEAAKVQVLDQELLARRELGLQRAAKLGISAETAGMVLKGPLAHCDGTLADLLGIENSPMEETIAEIANEAQNTEGDVNAAVEHELRHWTQRDDEGNIRRIELSPANVTPQDHHGQKKTFNPSNQY
jgi:hypothetical protein